MEKQCKVWLQTIKKDKYLKIMHNNGKVAILSYTPFHIKLAVCI